MPLRPRTSPQRIAKTITTEVAMTARSGRERSRCDGEGFAGRAADDVAQPGKAVDAFAHGQRRRFPSAGEGLAEHDHDAQTGDRMSHAPR